MAGLLEIFGIKKRDPISLAIEEAIGLMGEDEIDEAIQVLEDRAIRRDPTHKRAILHLGVCHMLKKNFDRAEELLEPLTVGKKMDSEKAAASIALEKIAKMREEEAYGGAR
ncbi:MAG: tetratricopeptide repeat protein [Planctomycetes bacterium]|nr:tetratricopeptide repeat protein [Planctomycetota bacterium]MCD7895452.1 tetratricopeptide repeat protein [Planctomycetaceae bacterium]